jgi:hypothetical protein
VTPSPGRPAIAVAGLSAAIFLLEVLLTRIFSVTLFHHFAFAAISMGMLGLAASGVRVALGPGRFSAARADEDVLQAATWFLATAVLALLVVVRIGVFPSFSWGAVARIVVVYGVCVVPFYFGGLGLSLIFTHGRDAFARLYAFDLVAAGLAGLGVYPVLRGLGGPAAAIAGVLVAVLAALWAYPAVRRPLRHAALAVAVVATLVVALDRPLGLLRLRDPKGQGASRPILFEAWNALSRVAVYDQRMGPWSLAPRYTGPIATGLLMDIDAAAGTAIVPAAAGAANDYLRYELTAVAHVVAPLGPALVIGAGGGRDVLAALLSGFAPIDAVEINPIIANDVMRGRFRKASGGLYDDPRVRVHVGDGRSFIEGTGQRYSLVQLSMVDTWAATAAGAFALSENNLYTVEAVRAYLKHLEPEGVLTLTRWAGGEVFRLVILVEEAARSLGVNDPRRHLAVLQHHDGSGPNVPVTLLYRSRPFDETTAQRLRAHAENCGFVWLHDPLRSVPGRISAVARASSPLAEARRTEDYELAASTDDRPFFFYRPRPFLSGLVEDPARVFVEGQYLVSFVLLLSAVLGALVILLPFGRAGVTLRAEAGVAWRAVPYFAALGLGFMFVEVSLMQRFVLYLGHPTHALTAVLAGLLMGAGLGSAGLAPRIRPENAGVAALGVIGALAVFAAVRASLFAATQSAPFAVKVLLTEALVVPLGAALGTLMPLGIARLARTTPGLVPWAWAVNGFASVVGASAGALSSMTWGFSATFVGAALCYGLAALAAFRERGTPRAMV